MQIIPISQHPVTKAYECCLVHDTQQLLQDYGEQLTFFHREQYAGVFTTASDLAGKGKECIMETNKPKTIQIDYDLFEDLYIYAARHAEPDDLQYRRIVSTVKKKLETLMKRELYSLYKMGASEEIRSKARRQYLDAAEIMGSFRWNAQQDVNVTHDEKVW